MARKNKKATFTGYYGSTTDSAELAANAVGEDLSFAASESYKLLRTNISFCLPVDSEKHCHVIGVTSSTQGEGKSTTSVNLSYSLAEAGYHTLLVDCDMRLPTVASKLGLKSAPGLSNLLSGQQTQGSSVQNSGLQKNLYVIASGDIPPNPSELLNSTRMGAVVGELNKYYDYIILDLPPVNIVSDALAVSKFTDGIVLVVREDYSEKRGVKDAVEKFKFSDAKILGFVLTCAGIDSGKGKKTAGSYRKYSYGLGYARYRKSAKKHGYGYGYGYDRSSASYKESADARRRQGK